MARINIPPLTRALLAALVLVTFLNAAARYRSWAPDRSSSFLSRVYYAPYLTIVPGTSILYPWVLITATFAEQNLFGLIATGISIFYGGRYLERAWSSTEYLKFITLLTLLPNVVTFAVYVTLFAISGNENLVTTAIGGGIAIQAGFLVAFKQLVPEHTITIGGVISARVKHFPALFLFVNSVSGILLGTDTAMLLAWLGFLASWIYLRFYRISSPSGVNAIKGDASDTFAFKCFFPDAIQPPIAILTDAVYNTMVTIRVCTPFSEEDVLLGNEHATARESELPSLLNNREAERRRALALRALDQRLSEREPTIVQPKVEDFQQS